VALLGVVVVISLGLLLFGLYQLWRLKRGLGRLLVMLQTNPRAGLAVCVEFFVWGLGWLVATSSGRNVGRGSVSLLLWVLWLAFFLSVQPIVIGMFAFFPPLIPLALVGANALMLMLFALFGLNSARALMKTLEREAPLPAEPTVAAA
jgi:hypothetical protein